MKQIGLYIHIPFCLKKCNYCDFVSFDYKEENANLYFKALNKEINLYKDLLSKYSIKTIFFGGGTPSIINIKDLCNIIDNIYKNFSVLSDIEFTIECNPGTIDEEKLKKYKSFGINRLSIGLQSFNNEILKFIGRIHTKEIFERNYLLARNIGFDNINIDLIYGLPNQSLSDWKNTLKKVVNLKPEHISAYSLKIEEGTRFYDLYKDGNLNLPEEEIDRQMYHYAIDYLKENNIYQYEISNFAKRGYECRHNIIYWQNEEYVGLGLSAHSYINSIRYGNTSDLKSYYNFLNNSKLPIDFKELKKRDDKIVETMFLGLRMNDGVGIQKFKEKFNATPFDVYGKKLYKLQEMGLIDIDDKNIKLTKYGMDVSNRVFVELLL
ncbi:oxygen-independent coproporphyrinogen-3 oxidase [Caminicella sporogenes DSM 14501]|uniref:Heme chaperone HemW n=1 Tax=Caminicella sporogenes DSM 14501 TaxID=1121266 RepID=A0A1M6MDN1_9FIRM|nr:radical SAM family heme chaperone HemW [Caminicella sporogenes]SHJ81413.1 oxygen-independent coproporphyrinogen-3 oxidase [Caminicella sporogenes DSM 14501]